MIIFHTTELELKDTSQSGIVIRVSSSIVIDVPTRDLLPVKIKRSFVSWLAKLQ